MKSSTVVVLVALVAICYGLLLRPVPVVSRKDYDVALREEPESLNLSHIVGRYKQPLAQSFSFPVHAEDYFAPLRHFFQEKRWHYTSVNTEKYFFAFAIVHLRYASTTFAYLVDKTTNEMFESGSIRPLGIGVEMSESSVLGCSRSGNEVSVCFDEKLRAWKVVLNVALDPSNPAAANQRAVRIVGEMSVELPQESLALVMPLDPTRIGYTHKVAGALAKGSLKMDGKVYEFDQAFAAVDWTKSLAKRLTVWKWVSVSARAKQLVNGNEHDVALGINFSKDVYDHDGVSQENAVWIDGKVTIVGKVEVVAPETAEAKRSEMWYIATPPAEACEVTELDCEYISLVFRPVGARSENMNLSPLLKSVFVQPVGTLSGTVKVKGKVLVKGQQRGRQILESLSHYRIW